MKVLLFSHKSDIDGLGSVVLAKLVFQKLDYVLCEAYNLDKEIEKYYNNNLIYSYDRIFITDLWLKEPMLSKVANDKKLKGKIFLFDHHESAIEDNYNKYDFTKIVIEEDGELSCGTSLFYNYLVKNNLIDKDNHIVEFFANLIRLYDTWEWINKYNEPKARDLSLLFNVVGANSFINLMYKKLQDENNVFSFNEIESMLIENEKNQVKEKLNYYSKKIFYTDIDNLKVGVVFIEYKYRNDLAEYLRKNNYDMDLVMLISMDVDTISYRNIKKGVKVRSIAEKLNGKGHDYAASSIISNFNKERVIELLTKCY